MGGAVERRGPHRTLAGSLQRVTLETDRWRATAAAGFTRGRSTLDDTGSPSPPIAVFSIEAFCSVVRDVFDRLTEKVKLLQTGSERFYNI